MRLPIAARHGLFVLRLVQAWLVAAVLVVLPVRSLRAHEIPRRVGVQAFVHPDGGLVRVVVRVPLEAMRDVEFPLRNGVLLDIARADSTLRDAAKLWVFDAMALEANGALVTGARLVAVRASLPSDHAFEQFDRALQTVQGPTLSVDTDVPVTQAMLDVLVEFPSVAPDASLALGLHVANLGVRTTTVLTYVPASGASRAYVYDGDEGMLRLEPQWWHAATRFVREGMLHLFGGIDHLLFLLCLIIPVRRVRALIGVVTAFTVAHSITLFASALGFAPDALWFPPLVEVLIAASIVYMAIENIVGAKLERRWMVAFGFGLVHGFGFSFALRDSLQFAGAHLVTALAAFNVGIELAQIAVLLVTAPLLAWTFRRLTNERMGTIIGSVLIAHTAWHWMTERFDTLRTYRFTWPAFDAAFAVGAMRVAMGLLAVGGAAWALSGVMARLARPRAGEPSRSTTMLVLWCMLAGGVMFTAPLRAEAQARPRTTMGGAYTADQAVKGKEVFQGTCSGCHTVASHSGPVFAARWIGRSLFEFYDYVSRLMPKSAPGTLSEDEYVWVTAYVLKLNGMPASKFELSAEPAILKAIRIDSTLAGTARAGGGAATGAAVHPR